MMRIAALLILPLFLVACQDWVKPSPFARGYVTYNEQDKTAEGPEVKGMWRRSYETTDQTDNYND